jgi:hypothetical protein
MCGRANQDTAYRGFTDQELEVVDLDNGCPPSVFPPSSVERHVNSRLVCQDDYVKSDSRRRDELGQLEGDHPLTPEYHQKNRLERPVGEKR